MSAGFCRFGLAAASVLLAFGMSVTVPQPASAQNLFDTLFGGLGWDDRSPRRERRYEGVPATAYAPHDQRRHDRFPIPDFGRRVERPAPAVGGGGGVHCVRMCDGRYFPLPRSANATRLDPVKVCSALCPAAATKVYFGSNMTYASAADGKRYADLDTAFAFRDRLVPDCSCTGQGPGGLAQIDVESDPTLRAGDIVVTASGPTVFRGSNQFPYQTADFTPIDDYARINKSLRDKLSEMQVNTGVTPVVPPQRLEAATGARQQQSAKPRPRAQPRRVESVFPQFRLW